MTASTVGKGPWFSHESWPGGPGLDPSPVATGKRIEGALARVISTEGPAASDWTVKMFVIMMTRMKLPNSGSVARLPRTESESAAFVLQQSLEPLEPGRAEYNV